jgi:hypothetical protein
VAVTVVPRPNGYSADEGDYFTEVALGFESGNASRMVRRWNQPIRYRVLGDPDEADLTALAQVVEEINNLTGLLDMVEVQDAPLAEIHFAPVSAQILGLGRDSNRYPQSIFYQPWTLVSEYAPIDRTLIEMLYRPEVRTGMGELELLRDYTRE